MRRAVTALLAFAALQATAAAAANEVEFGVFGDAGYSLPEEMALERMIPEINRESLAFNVFVGDFKNGSSPCTDALFRERRTLFEKSRAPLVYIPGDNDWTDCHRAGAGGYDPMERLRKLRELFYPSRLSLGNGKLPLVSQRDMKGSVCPACVEHLRWRVGAVLFTTLNVPGSNNNLGRTPTMDAEHASRSKAVAGWLDATIAEAARAPTDALVIFFQANPFFERTEPGRPPRRGPDGFDALRRQLTRVAQKFDKPVLVIHGDTHAYRDDRPLYDQTTHALVANVRRLEVFGSPIVNWIKVTVRPGTADPFEIRPAIPQKLAE